MDDIAGWLALLGLIALGVPVLLIVALVMVHGLKQRVGVLEQQVSQLRAARATESAPDELIRAPARPSTPVPVPVPVPATVAPSPVAMPPPIPEIPAARTPPTVEPALKIPPRPQRPSRPDFVTLAIRAVQRWFTVGNVPVKIGMLVLFAGVAALLKYGADQGWFTLPPELRLAGVALAALGALVFAWRKRESNRTFALSLQGGAIGVLLLVVFAAFKMFALMPAGAAFALSIVLVAGAGMLAVLQDAKALAVFALLAGFLAPIWLSTGNGSHVALFSYYAVLNAAIVGIAWHKSWRVLNLMGFAFTFGIGTIWGVLDYAPEKYASTQPFLVLFFVFYLLIPLLFARRQPAGRRDFIDGCLVFGTPLVAFSLQAGLMQGSFQANRLPLAFCALGLGVLYAALSWWLRRRKDYDMLVHAYALLAVGFATLAVPLALSARATASVFALEGAALVWLGLRQQRRLPQFTGAGLQLAAAFALLGAMDAWSFDAVAVANPTFMGALLIALAGFASAWACRSADRSPLAQAYYLWGLAWWCGAALREFDRFLPQAWHAQPDVILMFTALTGWLAAEVHRRRPASALAWTTLVALALAVPLALWQSAAHQQPFAGRLGALAWLVYLVLGVRSLLCLRDSEHRLAGAAQFVWWLVWPLAMSLLLGWLPGRIDGIGEGWSFAAMALPWLATVAMALFRWHWIATPLGERFSVWKMPLLRVLFLVLALWWLYTLFIPGAASPLPWLPVLNPMELAQLAAWVLAAVWLLRDVRDGSNSQTLVVTLSVAAFAWVTSAVLHTVHHWGAVPWNSGLVSTSLAQTSLTIVWSVLGVLGWVIGSRRGQRMLWLAGAVLMGVVLAKLVLVDRQHLGNLLGIGSFIGYGLLCTVVGYLAPAPPRDTIGEVPA